MDDNGQTCMETTIDLVSHVLQTVMN